MTHSYHISGMTCGSCVLKVKSELLKLGDVLEAEVQKEAPQATITMQRHIPLNTLQEALNKAGTQYRITAADTGVQHQEVTTADNTGTSYYPIILIFAYIAGITGLLQVTAHHFDPMQWMSHFMGGFFVVFSFFKLLNLKGFAEGYSSYDIVARQVRAYGFIYPFIELALGLAFLTGYHPLLTNSITLFIMSISTIGVVQSLLRKTNFQCACLGTIIQLPLSKVTLAEDLLMVFMSAIMLVLL
jgi:copper chaperone CopZ